jgi:GntR family transcriptional regulator, transcriptional repressor for pyruvate dehydrogenase complex
VIKAKESKSLSRRDEVHRQVLALITDGSMGHGDRLPSEADLAARFGVSRPTVREALTRLRDAGVITVRQGAGSFVKDADTSNNSEPSFGVQSLEEVRHCMEFRAALEGEAAARAALHNDVTSLTTASHALERLEQAIERESQGETADFQFKSDFDFHMAIATASGNPYFRRTLVLLRPAFEFTIGLSRSLSLTHSVERLRIAQAEHVAVFRAIEVGNPSMAREAMQKHLLNACRRIFEGPGS